jgi:hypothetical protein
VAAINASIHDAHHDAFVTALLGIRPVHRRADHLHAPLQMRQWLSLLPTAGRRLGGGGSARRTVALRLHALQILLRWARIARRISNRLIAGGAQQTALTCHIAHETGIGGAHGRHAER